jgi:predicted acylesterase/phospholipase RssA
MGNFHRALVFQGGGALGAYEAGTYQQVYRKASKESTDGRLFDIVAGTSIGAINSSVLVGHYLKNNSWKGSAEKLLEFWEGLGLSYRKHDAPGLVKFNAGWEVYNSGE